MIRNTKTRHERMLEEFENEKKKVVNPFLNITLEEKLAMIKKYGWTQELIAHIREQWLNANSQYWKE